MSKMKTNQSMNKRFRVTRQGKIIKRAAGQAHFNAREPGKVTRNKRSDVIVSRALRNVIKIALPYQ